MPGTLAREALPKESYPLAQPYEVHHHIIIHMALCKGGALPVEISMSTKQNLRTEDWGKSTSFFPHGQFLIFDAHEQRTLSKKWV